MTQGKWPRARSLGFFPLTFPMAVVAVLCAAPVASQGSAISIEEWSSAACQACHPREWADWSRSGHALTLSAQLTNPGHNASELLDQTCLKCHSPELGTTDIATIVQPIDTKGPWKLTDAYSSDANAPSISCMACHKSHTPVDPGLLPGMDFGDESTFYRNVAPPITTNLYVYDALAQNSVEPQRIADVLDKGKAIPIGQSLSNRLCYTCHATERAESNLFEPRTTASGDNGIGTGDDRTLTGAHQGIECVTCHMVGGSHSFNPMGSCGQCHGEGGATAPLAYVTKVRTSYNDPSLSMLSGTPSPLNIHWLDKTKLSPPYSH